MVEFSVGLALYNFVPVILTGIALWFLARFVRERNAACLDLALLGTALILAGGLSKAIWKLIAATTGLDIVWLANALFPLLAPGFAFLTAALWGVTGCSVSLGPHRAWSFVLAIILLVYAIAAIRQWVLDLPRGWFLPLLALASLGNLATSLLLIRAALQWRRWGIAALFAANLAMIFLLQPIAMATPKTLAMHWIEQSLTALGTGCLALAAYLLWRASMRPSIHNASRRESG